MDSKPLHILLFPLMSPGHFIPMIDMARVFSAHPNVRSTIVTTPSNAANIPMATLPANIQIITIPFPSPDETNLPANQENLSSMPSSSFTAFVSSLRLFRPSLRSVLSSQLPDCLVSDSLFPFTADLAAEFGIPRLTFHGTGAFPLVAIGAIASLLPFDPSKDSFVLETLPDKITAYRRGVPDLFDNIPFIMEMAAGEPNTYGVVVNTYREMEPAYVDILKQGPKKTWFVGPVALCNKRGGTPVEEGTVVSWLDGKPEGSVIYVAFGSLCHFGAAQLREIAVGLESSGKNFLWVVRKEAEGDELDEKEWMPQGFERRAGERGMVVRGWAPQTVVLGHRAVGWFVTHCGWNSLQEAVCAGVAMVTWPLFHEQFLNAEFAVEVLGVGVRMWQGFRKGAAKEAVVVRGEEVAEVVARVMGGGYEGMRRKAREYAEKAREAMEEGGSSYRDVTAFVEEMRGLRNRRSKVVV